MVMCIAGNVGNDGNVYVGSDGNDGIVAGNDIDSNANAGALQ